jgi:hypothetical protein
MKRVFQMVAATVLAVLALFFVGGIILSRNWRVERSVVIIAPPAKIHPYVEDLRQWDKWASWRSPDPTLKFTYSGPEKGVGATRSYTGERAGAGKTTITRSEPDAGVWFESTVNSQSPNASGAITYAPSANATEVTWKDEGQLPPIFGGYLRDSVEQGLAAHLEQALARLKKLVEESDSAAASTED